MSVKTLRLIKTVQSRGEASGLLKSSGDAVLIERGRPRWLLISCPCGCGEEFPINLDPRAGKAWRLYISKGGILSLFPSVWRDSGCYCHYVIWRNRIMVFDRNDYDEFDKQSRLELINQLTEPVVTRLPVKGLISYSDIADDLGEIPWDVLIVCRQLVRSGVAYEGAGKERTLFGLLQKI